MYDKLAFAVLTPQQSQIDKRFAAILGIKEAKQLLDKQIGLTEEDNIRNDLVHIRKTLDQFVKADKEFKRKLTLMLSQMFEKQEISQEAFDKLNALISDFIEGDTVDLDNF